MKRSLNIVLSLTMLILIMMGTSGVSVEKCSCSGKTTVKMLPKDNCCPSEGHCMIVKTMSLSDYLPVVEAAIDAPAQPVLFQIVPDIVLSWTASPEGWTHHTDYTGSSGPVGTTIAVLRV